MSADVLSILDTYLEKRELMPATIRRIRRNAGQFLSWCEAQELDPVQAGKRDIETYFDYHVDELGTSPRTLKEKRAAARHVFKALVECGLRSDVPVPVWERTPIIPGGWRSLLAAILLRAAKDAQSNNGFRAEARAWLASDCAVVLAEELGIRSSALSCWLDSLDSES